MADVDEATWAAGIAPHLAKWENRGNTPGMLKGRREYAAKRASALRRTYAARTRGCSERGTEVICGCGRSVRPWGCRQHLTCVRCRVQRAKKLTTRVRRGLDAALFAAGDRYHFVMMTMANRHTGDLNADRRNLTASWARFRKSCHKLFGAFSFVGTVEFTAGRDGLGHPHLHVVCIWPRTYAGSGELGDYALLRELWVNAATDSENVSFKHSNDAKKAAGYIAKYVAKGVTSTDFGPILAAKICAATYNTRFVLTSVKFWTAWVPACPCCGLPICRVRFGWKARDARRLRPGLNPERFDDWKPKPWGPFKRKFQWGWQFELPLQFHTKLTGVH